MQTRKPIYLDFAATTPVLPQAREAFLRGMAMWANPSSPHGAGRAARAALEGAREAVRAALGWGGEVIFTSGASEALALAVGRSVVPLRHVSDVEHEAVLRLAERAGRWGVGADGLVVVPEGPEGPEGSEPRSGLGLVAVQQVNNETGVIQPLAEIALGVHGRGGVLLADCAQAAGKIALPVGAEDGADMIAISAHKFGGPVGIGALLVRDFGLLRPSGGQERGYRGGTENLPGALAMAAALQAGDGWMAEATRLRARLEAGIVAGGGEVVATGAPRIATIGAYRMPGMTSAAQLIRFDAQGMAISAGSACSSGSMKVSHVLRAMGQDGADQIIRVSIGRETGEDEIDRFVEAWQAMAGEVRGR